MSNPIENVKTPLFAAVGAGDYALQAVTEVATKLRERAEARTADWQAKAEETRERLQGLPEDVPTQISDLREKFTPEELRKVAEAYVQVATDLYNSLAERGEGAVERLRHQPLVEENLERAEAYVADARELTEEALGTVAARTREVGERAAKLGGLVSNRIGDASIDAGEELNEAADRVVDAGADAADKVTEIADKAKKSATEAAAKVSEAAQKQAPAAKRAAPAAPSKPAAKATPATPAAKAAPVAPAAKRAPGKKA
ncbi:hypothetical protein [Tomitella biformata]|uniref:hypothetical protein n=1 Tax=Tomitella biformata TaxID=630403 RepID=UPI0004652250|nr:hypothetical protein [Tomitella biformata]